MTTVNHIRTGSIVTGPTLPEPVEVLVTMPMGSALRIIGRGRNTGMTYDPVLAPAQIAQLQVSAEREPFDGDARLFRLGIEAQRLGLAYEYDPFFSLSIARVDPLPHQLEAVYVYFLRLPRIRFLLADDPGSGKTIMGGLTHKELKARGLVKRVLIVAPANLTFQWQREMADKFHERFEVIRGATLRANYGQNPWQEHDQVITSVSWASLVDDARESLLRSRWDLVIVDEAHRMSARSEDHTTYAYRLGRELSKMTDHYLLMTATPHKGDAEHFRRFLALLRRLQELAEQRTSFAFETTLASRTFAPWLTALIASGHGFHLVFLWLPSADFAVDRVADRVRMGGHDVPEPTIRRRYESGLRNFFSLYRPIATSWRMYDNSQLPTMRLIASGRLPVYRSGAPADEARVDQVTRVENQSLWQETVARYCT